MSNLTKDEKLTAENIIDVLNDMLLKNDIHIVALLEQISETTHQGLVFEGSCFIRELRNHNLSIAAAISRLLMLIKGGL